MRLIGVVLAFCLSAYAQEPSCPTSSSGDLDVVRFESKVFGNARMLRILLPPGYKLASFATRHYSVLYLNDGQNLFDACTPAPKHEQWHVEEAVAALTAAGDIPPIIVVGIDSAGYPDPHGNLYPQFLLQEVIPFIERRYRVRTGAANRGLGGASYGADAALYTLIARPDSFYGLLLESPNTQLLKEAAEVQEWPRRVFIGIGTGNVGNLESILRKAGLDDRRLRVVVQPGHRLPGSRLPDALRFLFAIR